MIPRTIRQQLTDKEITDIDMRLYGELILSETVTLSQTVNTELLEPMSAWLDDPDFMKQFDINLDDDAPNWADYKRKQRQWTEQQKLIAAERLRRYWREINRKRKLQSDLAKLFTPLNNPNTEPDATNNPQPNTNPTAITSILAAFSPVQQHKRETEQEFTQSLDMHLSNLLPWRLILTDTLAKHGNAPTTFRKLDQIIRHNKKADAIAKFQHLLQMECDGDITLEQSEPDQNQGSEPNQGSDITIIPRSAREMTACATESKVIIKDRSGEEIERDWHTLSDAQRNKVIADAIERRILCKVMG